MAIQHPSLKGAYKKLERFYAAHKNGCCCFAVKKGKSTAWESGSIMGNPKGMGAFKKFKMDPNERPVYYVDRIHRKTSFSQKTLLGYLPYPDEGYLKVFLADYT